MRVEHVEEDGMAALQNLPRTSRPFKVKRNEMGRMRSETRTRIIIILQWTRIRMVCNGLRTYPEKNPSRHDLR